MAAALAAARSGHEVTLFSGSAPAALVGGLQLAPNGWAALRDLGLTGAAEKLSIRLTEITVRSLGTGSTLIRLPLHEPYEASTVQGLQSFFGILSRTRAPSRCARSIWRT